MRRAARLGLACICACVLGAVVAATALGAPADSAAARVPARARRAPNVLAWPIYVRWDSDRGGSLRVVGPVTARVRSPRERSFYAIYPTTGFRRLAAGRTELDLAWPLASWVRDSARGLTAVNLLTPLVGFERRSDERVSAVRLSPLYLDERHSDGRRRFALAPFYWASDDPARLHATREYGYLPFLGGSGLSLLRTWSTPDGGGWSSTFVAGGIEDADTRWRWVFPYLSWERFAGEGSPASFRSFGGVWSAWRAPERQAWELALLWNGGRVPRHSWLSLPPWVSWDREDSAGATSRFRTLAPLWARWQSPRSALWLALPSLWSWRSERFASSGAWPFYASFRRARPDSSWREGGSFAWPFLTWGRGEDYSAFGVLPLFYRLRDGGTSLTLAPPLYGSFRGPDRDVRVAPPFWFRRITPGDSLEAFTLYYRHRKPSHFAHGVAPLWESAVDRDVRRSFILPVWYSRSDPRSRFLALPGWLDWRSFADDRRTIFAGPVVVTRGRDSRGFGVVPVLYTGAWPGGGATLAGPFFWNHGPGGQRGLGILPLAWYGHARGTTDLFLLPLTGTRRHADGRENTWVLWPLYTHRTWADGRARHSLLLGLGRDERHGPKRRAWLQPLVYYDRPSEESSWLAVLGGLLASYQRDGAERRLRVLMIPVRTWGR